jgi:cytochrome d ubiquinol oxidase subunit I
MNPALDIHRLQFAFTATFHYLFPQVTMGLALLLFILKTIALRTGDVRYERAARFWARIFGISFAIGVVTGIPLEFEFGTNWAIFSRSAGGVIGQTLAMEGVFSFFLESSFVGMLLYGERRAGRVGHWLAALLVWLGSWLSGYFIVATNAWMQHPVGYTMGPAGQFELASLGTLLANPWALWEYAHTMLGAVQTGCFLVAAVGAYDLLAGRDIPYAKIFLRVAVIVGICAAILQLFPTGDGQGVLIAQNQPVTLAAMEGLFHSEAGAPIAILGQPDGERHILDNPLIVPNALSFLTYRAWKAEVQGLDAFPPDTWPDSIDLVYYSYHIMVGLGTIFIAILLIAAWKLLRGTLFTSRAILWALLLAFPFPFIANTAGWITAEAGRQPWLIYGLQRTAEGVSPQVSGGNVWFTFLGFAGLYMVLGILFLFLTYRVLDGGPDAGYPAGESSSAAAPQPAGNV